MKYTQDQLQTLWNKLQPFIVNEQGETKGDTFHVYGGDECDGEFVQLDMGERGSIRIERREQGEELNPITGEWEPIDRIVFWATDFSDTEGDYPEINCITSIDFIVWAVMLKDHLKNLHY